ncbi:hypothetical protein Leryth_002389 [Lithospermum erythrorhizon]|nr:hypothetical protein Leryth_002389 [Lithospermum erythrorhizon]
MHSIQSQNEEEDETDIQPESSSVIQPESSSVEKTQEKIFTDIFTLPHCLGFSDNTFYPEKWKSQCAIVSGVKYIIILSSNNLVVMLLVISVSSDLEESDPLPHDGKIEVNDFIFASESIPKYYWS